MSVPSTFSIVAYDPVAQEWGVAVQSKFLAVGAAVPWAQAGAGAVATQAEGQHGLRAGGAGDVGARLERARDVGLAGDCRCRTRSSSGGHGGRAWDARPLTGKACMDWAGGVSGPGYACQGNILVGPDTVQAMAQSFEHSQGELADRLVAALAAGKPAATGAASRARPCWSCERVAVMAAATIGILICAWTTTLAADPQARAIARVASPVLWAHSERIGWRSRASCAASCSAFSSGPDITPAG